MVLNLRNTKRLVNPIPPELDASIEQTRADYERWLDARYAAARGHVDALLDPLETRRFLELAFEAATAYPGGDHLPIDMFGDARDS